MAENGQLPGSELEDVGGDLRLRKDAAEAFLAMNREARVSIRDAYRPLGAPGDLARGRWSQWAAWERYQQGGNLAAYPGTSNHGWGTAIDLSSEEDRATLDRIGGKYGWSKSWSDAPGEWWHILYQPGHYHPPPPDPHHYRWIPVSVPIFGTVWNARYIVEQYDKYRAMQTPKLHPRRLLLAKYRRQLRQLAGRAWKVAHMSRPPAWNDGRRLGWQYQQFRRRADGDRLV